LTVYRENIDNDASMIEKVKQITAHEKAYHVETRAARKRRATMEENETTEGIMAAFEKETHDDLSDKMQEELHQVEIYLTQLLHP